MANGPGHKRRTADSFDEASASYRDSDVHREGDDLERLAEWCGDATTVLDVATGAGHTAGAVAERGVPTVVAVDASRSMVETAVGEYGVGGALADAERLPFARAAFDAVACRIAAHHFPDPVAFVAEVSRVLRPGGTLAFEDSVAPDDGPLGRFVNEVERVRDPTHVESHPADRWCQWFEEHDLAVEETDRLRTTLDFETWTDAQSLSAAERDRVERRLLDAPPAAAEAFEVLVEDGTVRSFANHKLLLRARRR